MEEYDKIFNNDPIYMKSLLGKQVKIKTVDSRTHSGIVYVIDPVFKTVVLHTNWKSNKDHDTLMIMHHAIESLEELPEPVNESYLEETSEHNSKERKYAVKKWLKKMMINVKESGDYLKVDDHLVIVPPYGPENCICNNTIVLEKVQNILETMPKDFC
ncbi:gem-associated protein 6 [Diabrotica virgifera virgifera]|uniref:AD domain-containing protein n=1 Tax=Diabrotica virgifera virgifera TaxID=50390 RepID=A0ABM5IIZ8_DIAVI|nr:gem-associated protein 6 [Diabrotica virgifera virgifera]